MLVEERDGEGEPCCGTGGLREEGGPADQDACHSQTGQGATGDEYVDGEENGEETDPMMRGVQPSAIGKYDEEDSAEVRPGTGHDAAAKMDGYPRHGGAYQQSNEVGNPCSGAEEFEGEEEDVVDARGVELKEVAIDPLACSHAEAIQYKEAVIAND